MNLPRIPEGTVNSPEELVRAAAELTDDEVRRVGRIWSDLVQKYQYKRNTVENLDALRREALNRFAEINVLITLDPAPCFYGEPPVMEIVGKVSSDLIHKYGFDHERKRWEVLRAEERGEEYYGQIERVYTPRQKKTDGSS